MSCFSIGIFFVLLFIVQVTFNEVLLEQVVEYNNEPSVRVLPISKPIVLPFSINETTFIEIRQKSQIREISPVEVQFYDVTNQLGGLGYPRMKVFLDKGDGRVQVDETDLKYVNFREKINLTLYDEGDYDKITFTFAKWASWQIKIYWNRNLVGEFDLELDVTELRAIDFYYGDRNDLRLTISNSEFKPKLSPKEDEPNNINIGNTDSKENTGNSSLHPSDTSGAEEKTWYFLLSLLPYLLSLFV